MRDKPQNLSQGLAYGSLSNASIPYMRTRLKSREISDRKQVGDVESMMNEEPASIMPGRGSEWLD